MDHLQIADALRRDSTRESLAATLLCHSHHVDELEARLLLLLPERVRGERALFELTELGTHRVVRGVVERRAQRLLGRRPRALYLDAAVGLHDLLLLDDELGAGEHELEESRREAREHLRVRRVLLDREADGVAAQVP